MDYFPVAYEPHVPAQVREQVAESRFISPCSPHVPARIWDMVESLQKAFPVCLITPLRFRVFDGIIRHAWMRYDNHSKHRILLDLGRNAWNEDPVTTAMNNLNVSYTEAVVVVGHLLEIKPENVFGVFPGIIDPVEPWKPVTINIPQCLVVNGQHFDLEVNDLQLDFSGKPLFAVLGFTSKTAPAFVVMAARKKDSAGFWTMEVGKAQAPNLLLGAAEIELNRQATIVLADDINTSLDLRTLANPVEGLEQHYVVSGATQALNTMQLSTLMFRDIILLPSFSLDGLRATADDAKLLLKEGAASVRIYPWPLQWGHREARVPWETFFLANVTEMTQVDNVRGLLTRIDAEALTLHEYTALLLDRGLLVLEENGQNADGPSSMVKTYWELDSETGHEASSEPDLAEIFSKGQISLIWGPSNSGKSLFSLWLAHALATGSSALGIRNSGAPAKVLIVDAEITDGELVRRYTQISGGSPSENVLFLPTRGMSTDACNVLDEAFGLDIIKQVKTQGIRHVVLDNLISLASKATRGSEDSLFALIREIEKAGASVILVHHSNKAGDAVKGSVNFVSKAQNVLHLEGRDALKKLDALSASVEAALGQEGAVVRLTWDKTKQAYSLEGRSFFFRLPPNGTWQPIGDDVQTPCELPEVSPDKTSVSDQSCPPAIETAAEKHDAAILALLADGDEWAKKTIANELDLGKATIEARLTALKEAGKIETVGAGPTTKWRIMEL